MRRFSLFFCSLSSQSNSCLADLSMQLVCSCLAGTTICGRVCCISIAVCLAESSSLCCSVGNSLCLGTCCAGVCLEGTCCPMGSINICDGVCCTKKCKVRRSPPGLCQKNPELCDVIEVHCNRLLFLARRKNLKTHLHQLYLRRPLNK